MPQDTPHASWPELVGDDMLQGQGAFANEGDWGMPSNSEISGGKFNWSGVAAGDGAINFITPGSAFISGARYMTLISTSGGLGGGVAIQIGDEGGTLHTSNDTNFSEVLTAVDPLGDGFKLMNTTGDPATIAIDNVSCKSFQGMGQEVSWAFTGAVEWNPFAPAGVLFSTAAEGDTASLTGGSKTAFDAAVSNSTACSVSMTAGANGLSGTVFATLKGGTPVAFVFSGDPGEVVTHTVTSGTGSGFDLTAGNDNPDGGKIVRITITLA